MCACVRVCVGSLEVPSRQEQPPGRALCRPRDRLPGFTEETAGGLTPRALTGALTEGRKLTRFQGLTEDKATAASRFQAQSRERQGR